MSAVTDLHDIVDLLDAIIHGAPFPTSIVPTTQTGGDAWGMAKELRRRLYMSWSEGCALRGRLAMALRDVDGLRATNERLTNLLESAASPAPGGKE